MAGAVAVPGCKESLKSNMIDYPKNSPRVLSIQSHVVHGYVGNRSVVFPLQLHGFEVDFINSVQFSNHTWYKDFKGSVLDDKILDEIYMGLKKNDFLAGIKYIMTGYIGSAPFLHKVADIVVEMKKNCSTLIFVCDPVMGDKNTMYVPDDLLPIYKNKMISLADILLPNQFELQKLTGRAVNSEADILKAIAVLHSSGPRLVVVTSSDVTAGSNLLGYASYSDGTCKRCVRMEIPRVDGFFIGTGDLFSALWVVWTEKLGLQNIMEISKKVASTMLLVLRRTYAMAKVSAKNKAAPDWSDLELKLVQSKRDIEEPIDCVTVRTIQVV